MPYAKRSKVASKPRKAYRKKRSVVRHRKTIAPMETATLKETLILNDLSGNAPYESQVRLTQFRRALDVADNYQLYRVSKVEYIYTPRFDTFVNGSGQPSVPYLYTKILSYPAPDTFGLQFMTAMGAKPKRLDDKTLRVIYKPHILQGGLDAVGQGTTTQNYTRPIKAPWLNTHVTDSSGNIIMDNTVHYGHATWIDQDASDPAFSVCNYTVNVYFEFCKPWDLSAQLPPAGTPMKVIN